MKKKYTGLMVVLMLLNFQAQQNPKEEKPDQNTLDSIQERKLEIARLVDSLNFMEIYDEDFYTLNENGEVVMNEITYAGMPAFYNKLDEAYYYWLKKKLYNAYPYYLEVVRNYEGFNDSISIFKNNSKMRKYFKKRQKQLANQYEDQLKDLTRTEGQILSKLVYRRTQKTTYEIIQELRGGLNAFIWETKAGFFDISLKKEFDPENVREDFFIDNIIYRGINDGELKSEDYIDLDSDDAHNLGAKNAIK